MTGGIVLRKFKSLLGLERFLWNVNFFYEYFLHGHKPIEAHSVVLNLKKFRPFQ